MMKTLIKYILNKYNLIGLYYISKSGPLHDYGWFRSIKENKIVNKYGDPIPWFNYSMIEFLENRIKLNFNVFEYGSGSSTFWWAKRVNRLYSCEHDEIWFEKHKTEIMKENVDYTCKSIENKEYENYITNFKNYFDIIIIDGRRRINCSKNSITSLNNSGVIIWDNTDRIEYVEGIRYLEEQDFKRISISGLVPCINGITQTSIFYRQNNCLNI